METLKSFIKWLWTVAKRVHWISLLSGLTVGVPIWWTVQAFMGTRKFGAGVELAVGVVLGALAGWAVPEFISYIRHLTTFSKPLNKIFGEFASNTKETIIAMPTLFPKETNAFLKKSPFLPGDTMEIAQRHGCPWVYTENDARAMAYCLSLLAAAGKRKNISIIRDDESLNIQSGNFICIGSPKSSLKSKQLFDSYKDLPVCFVPQSESVWLLKSKLSRDVWEANSSFDHGLILKVHDSSSTTLVLAGISHVGTGAAGWFLWRNWQHLASNFEESNFAIVLRTDKNYHHICNPVFKAKLSRSGQWEIIQ